MKKENIYKLKQNYEKELSIAILQIKSPFYDEITIGNDPRSEGATRKILVWTDTDKRCNKILELINKAIIKYTDINIITLPEYSVPKNCWGELKSIADKHNIIIVGGSNYDASLYKNICPVFLPNEETKFVIKSDPSFYESDLFFDKKNINKANHYDGTLRIQLNVEKFGIFEIQIFICSDLLKNAVNVNETNPGIILCLMCSTETSRFYGLAEYLLSLTSPKYVVFNNSCSPSNSKLKIIGNSGICCSVQDRKNGYPKLDHEEGIMYAKLNITSPIIKKPKSIHDLMPISNIEFSSIKNDGKSYSFCDPCGTKSTVRSIINPDIFRVLGKKFRLFYLRCNNYPMALAEIKKTKTCTYAVLGNVDVIVRNIDDASGKLRSYELFQASQYIVDDSWNYFSVDRFIKYDGELVNSGVNAIEETPTFDELIKIVELGRGLNYNNEILETIKKNKWVLGEVEDCQDNSKIRAIININLPELSPTGDILNRFNSEVLTRYHNNINIHGIYEGGSRGLQAQFVLEICSNVKELFNIIDDIYNVSSSKNIRVNTNTYLISQRLTEDIYSNLLIQSVPYQTSNIIDKYIAKDISQDFCNQIRQLSLERQENIVQFYIKINRQHGTLSSFMKEEIDPEIKEKYNRIIELVDDLRKEFTIYLVYKSNFIKVSNSFNSIFGLFDVHFTELIKFILQKQFNNQFDQFLSALPKSFVPNPIKHDQNRLTISERLKLVQGFTNEFKTISSHEGLNLIISIPELPDLINYRNTLQHHKTEEIEKIDIRVFYDLAIKMLSYITPDFVKFLKFPKGF